ncbi:LacI family DNA-binding transcriptional regulator [Sphingomonas jeddahensis]|uniref:Catabolite control protein A n=1 Tax=Sphingomonas jeddahensis TaxID=1915074 RepID=A0A1V2ETI3_9SPHN|nr:LacI family DNA-binding transcriptional regulator [Sphingomonas jeddahensis]ONF95986.1 Catabolite control protein A [Sphingomonas jeddahensis]
MNAAGISPEQRLFVGVIVNAAQEAAGVSRVGSGHRTIRQSARAWFSNGGDDFRTVCELAGFEPGEVRTRVLAYLNRVEHDPDALIKVKRTNMPPRHHRVSIPDVARAAGVSATTASKVIHDRPNVSPATRARVLAAIEATGYSRHVH